MLFSSFLLQRSRSIGLVCNVRRFSTGELSIWQREVRGLSEDYDFVTGLDDLPPKERAEVVTYGRKMLDKECAKILKTRTEFQRVGDAVSNRSLYFCAENILPDFPDLDFEDVGRITRAAVGLIHPSKPEATQELAQYLMQMERDYGSLNPVKFLKYRSGSVTCKRNGEDGWIATATMHTIDGWKEKEATSRFDWAAKEFAANAVLEEDPLFGYYGKYPEACDYFETFHMEYQLGDSCPTCGHKCDDLESLLHHMETNPYGFDMMCADVKNGLDWDACGISHETGEFMWGND